jgi:hypothetical protein
MVIVFNAQAAVTPVGNPVAVPIPVAPVVVWLIFGDKVVLIHKVGEDDAIPTMLSGFTIIVPEALTVPHPPVSGIL